MRLIKTYKDLIFILFVLLWLICDIVFVGIFDFDPICVNLIAILLFMLLVLCKEGSFDFATWLETNIKENKLSDEEIQILNSVEEKAKEGYNEWYNITHGDDHCGPWISDLTPEEKKLIDNLHEKYYGLDWYVNISIGVKQVYYIKYMDIRDKVIFNKSKM